MNDLLKEALTSLAVIPVAFFLLRLIFGRSIMFKISLSLVILMIFIAFISSVEYMMSKTMAAMVTLFQLTRHREVSNFSGMRRCLHQMVSARLKRKLWRGGMKVMLHSELSRSPIMGVQLQIIRKSLY